MWANTPRKQPRTTLRECILQACKQRFEAIWFPGLWSGITSVVAFAISWCCWATWTFFLVFSMSKRNVSSRFEEGCAYTGDSQVEVKLCLECPWPILDLTMPHLQKTSCVPPSVLAILDLLLLFLLVQMPEGTSLSRRHVMRQGRSSCYPVLHSMIDALMQT